MLMPFRDLLERRRAGSAIGAFTCYDLEQAVAVLRAAESAETGVILLLASRSFGGEEGDVLAGALVVAAARSAAPACVQLDHSSDLGAIERALAAGVGAVMADGSKLPYAENVALVRDAVERAAAAGAGVEAELGSIAGDEDFAVAATAGAFTDPAEAAAFVAETGVDCLAVSIGNVHGAYRERPVFDWDRLRALCDGVAVPLSLHGSSGVPDAMITRSIALGIGKINVNTELREAYLAATVEALPVAVAGAWLSALHRAQTDAVAGVVCAKLRTFTSGAA
jgi:ketose-bisphosphate aldolase